jgi:hypothetical protein
MVVVDQSIQDHKVVNTTSTIVGEKSMFQSSKRIGSKLLIVIVSIVISAKGFTLDSQSYAKDFLNEMIEKENGIKNLIDEELADTRELQQKGINKLIEIKVRCNSSAKKDSKLPEESLQILRVLNSQISDTYEFMKNEEKRIAIKIENDKQNRSRYCPSQDGDLVQYMRCVQKDTIWRIAIKREYEINVNNIYLKQFAEIAEDIKICSIDKKIITSYDLQVTSELLEAFKDYIAFVDKKINDGLIKLIYQ